MLNLRAIPSSVPLESTQAITKPANHRSIHFDGHALLVIALTGVCIAFSVGATIFAYRYEASMPILATIFLTTFSVPRLSLFLCAGV
jgi:hypothetical protein